MIDKKYLEGQLYGVSIYESENAPIVGVDTLIEQMERAGGSDVFAHPEDIKTLRALLKPSISESEQWLPDTCPDCGRDSKWVRPAHEPPRTCLECTQRHRLEQQAEDWVEETWGSQKT